MKKTTRPLVPVPMSAPVTPAVIDDAFIKSRIHTFRGEQVMLSPDLADLYQVETRAFNQAVKRNEERFPPSFRFQLTKEELREVITNCDNPDRKGNPRPKILPADIAKFNAQYPSLSVRFCENFHDRFLVVDDRDLFLIGASLKDLGKKCFGFTKMDPAEIPGLKARL